MKFIKKKKNTEELSSQRWKVLIVDDEKEVHTITYNVLKNIVFMNKKLEFFNAYSGTEAIDIVKKHSDIDLILLDVMMETDDAGLKVVKVIREELNNSSVRIVLRTGQPGLYPPKDIIVDYDIDDYKEKTELTSTKLFISIISSLRMSHYISQINTNNEKLQETIKDEISKNREKDRYIIEQNRRAQLGDMLSMIAHQWRQPLAAISSSASSLVMKSMLNRIDKDFILKIANKILQYSDHLSTTIDDFKDFFQPNKEKSYTTIDNLVNRTLDIIKPSINGKYIDMKIELNCDVGFDTYENEFQHVILNILQNSQDAFIIRKIDNGSITIKSSYDDKNMILEISDNAGGIPQNIVKNIFDPYFSTKREKNGTGLGLYMSKTIIEDHCMGFLNVENYKDGAKFTITIPRQSNV